jgi:hypothetical protein
MSSKLGFRRLTDEVTKTSVNRQNADRASDMQQFLQQKFRLTD